MWRASMGNKGPREVDELYLWEITVLIGNAEELKTETETDTKTNGQRRPGRVDGAADLLKRRILAAKGLGPVPEAPPIDRKAFEATAGALRVGTG